MTIPVPDSIVAGPYVATLNVIDKKGNESSTSSINVLMFSAGNQPVVNITSPDLSQNFQIPKGDTLNLQGLVFDDLDLEFIFILLEAETNLYDEEFDLTDTVQTAWNFNELSLQDKRIIIPTNADNGDHELVIIAVDNDEHSTIHQSTVTVVD